jgi:hypothetical protein
MVGLMHGFRGVRDCHLKTLTDLKECEQANPPWKYRNSTGGHEISVRIYAWKQCFLMDDSSSVSDWIERFRENGNEIAALKLWDRINPRIRELSRRWIRKIGLPVSFDEDDVTVSVFATFCDRLRSGQLPELNDRDGLWRLLILMTARKVQ